MAKRWMAGLMLAAACATGASGFEAVSQADFDRAVGCFAGHIGVYNLLNARAEDWIALNPDDPAGAAAVADTIYVRAEGVGAEIDAIAMALDQLTHPAYELDTDRAMLSFDSVMERYAALLEGTIAQREAFIESDAFEPSLSDACYDLVAAINAAAEANVASGDTVWVE